MVHIFSDEWWNGAHLIIFLFNLSLIQKWTLNFVSHIEIVWFWGTIGQNYNWVFSNRFCVLILKTCKGSSGMFMNSGRYGIWPRKTAVLLGGSGKFSPVGWNCTNSKSSFCNPAREAMAVPSPVHVCADVQLKYDRPVPPVARIVFFAWNLGNKREYCANWSWIQNSHLMQYMDRRSQIDI